MLLDIWENIIVSNLSTIFLAIYLFTVFTTVILVIHEKRDPAKTSVWVLILLLLPIIGLIFYAYFGQNYRKEKIFSRKGLVDLRQIDELSRSQLVDIKSQRYIDNPSISNNLKIITLLLNNSKALLTLYNKVKIYQTGKRTFNAILSALKSATQSIHLEFYIVNNDEIGNTIKEILVDKAKQGVEVRLIFDDVGSWNLPKKYIKEITDAGGEVYPFQPVKFPLFTSKINYRNHRKIIVVDGKVAYMGGMNIADRYLKGDGLLGTWYDTVLKIEGEAVHMLQLIFLVDWFFVSTKVLEDRSKYFPSHKVSTQHSLQITASGPDSDWASIMQAFFVAINNAKKHIYIASPYFVPNESILTALKTASLSGIDVRIMLPGKSDSTVVYWSSMSYVKELLDAGINVYLFHGGFNHSKILMIDSKFASVGSANMDIRSFEDNFEVLTMIYDEELTITLEERFLKDIKKSKQVEPDEWVKRSRRQNFNESFARMFSPLF
ncbi:MAG: cardiolipin synthase [Bacteroidales bacterium]